MVECRSRGREFNFGPVHTVVEIYHIIISTVILLLSAGASKKGCWLLFIVSPSVGVCNCSMFAVSYFMFILVLQ